MWRSNHSRVRAQPSFAAAGFPLSFQTPMYDLSHDDVNEEIVRQAVQRKMGTDVARLFYSYRQD